MKKMYQMFWAVLWTVLLLPAIQAKAICRFPKGWSEKDSCATIRLEGSRPLDATGKPYIDSCHVYSWSFGDSTTSGDRVTTHTYTRNGTYTICMKVRDTCNRCDTTICKTVTITCYSTTGCRLPRGWGYKDSCPVFRFEGFLPLDSAGKPYTDGCIRYSWNFGDGGTSNDRLVNHTYKKNGTYTVCMKVRDTCHGCDSTICKTITVSCVPATGCRLPRGWGYKDSCPVFRFEGFLPLDSAGKPYTDGCIRYSWNFGDGGIANDRLVNHTYKRNGIYTVCMKVRDTCRGCDTTICKIINVTCVPASRCRLPDGWGYNIDTCGIYRFEGRRPVDSAGRSYTDSCQVYHWDFGDSTDGSGRNIVHHYTITGNYVVCMKVTDTCRKCDTTICKLVNVTCASPITVSVGSIEKTPLATIYPNPASASFTLQCNGNASYTVCDAYGKSVVSGNLYNSTVIPAAALPEGLYFIRVQVAGEITVLKLQVRR